MFNPNYFRASSNIIDYSCYCPEDAPLHGFTDSFILDRNPVYLGKQLPEELLVSRKEGQSTEEYLRSFTQNFCGNCIKCSPTLVRDMDTDSINLFPKRNLAKLQ